MTNDRFYTIFLSSFLLFCNSPLNAQSTVGTDFWVAFLPNYGVHPNGLTLVATDVGKFAVVDGKGIRKLTLREGLRLNGYPEEYNLNIDYTKGMDLLGNTVVVPIIKMICDRVLENEVDER